MTRMKYPVTRPHANRRAFVAGSLATVAALAVPGCATTGGPISFTEAIRRLLVLSSERAFTRLTAPGGFWDQQVAQVGLGQYFGSRGNVLGNILTSTLFKSRLEDVVADVAVDASYRAAPVVADTVRTIGFANAVALIRGGPTAGTAFLQQAMGPRLLDVLVPEVGQALRIAQEPLVGQLIAGLTGIDLGGVARGFAGQVEKRHLDRDRPRGSRDSRRSRRYPRSPVDRRLRGRPAALTSVPSFTRETHQLAARRWPTKRPSIASSSR